MKRLLIFLLLINLTTFSVAQSYKDSIRVHREKYKQDFLEEERSPIKEKKDLEFLQFYDPDESYCVTAGLKRTLDAKPFELPTLNGKTKTYIEFGTLSFSLHGKPYKLKIFQSVALMSNPEYKDHLFLPFTDETNGSETYTNGRYIDLVINDIHHDTLVIDFNKSYNPYCAYSTGYSCPKPPEENDLKVIIRAGEKNFEKSIH